MTPCSTLEQRWSACRDGIREQAVHPRASWARLQWEDCWTPARVHCGRGDFLGWLAAEKSDRRPCTSPRRHQCRSDFWCDWDTQDTYCDDRPDA